MRIECLDCKKDYKKTTENYGECKEKNHRLHLYMEGCINGHKDSSLANTHYFPEIDTDPTIPGKLIKPMRYSNFVFEKVEEHNFTVCYPCILERDGKNEEDIFKAFMNN
jgi:hypothetical protein